MQGEACWVRLGLIGAAGMWVALATFEDALLAKLLGMALAVVLVLNSIPHLQRQHRTIVGTLIGSLLCVATKGVIANRRFIRGLGGSHWRIEITPYIGFIRHEDISLHQNGFLESYREIVGDWKASLSAEPKK